jgi:hypothetical protein
VPEGYWAPPVEGWSPASLVAAAQEGQARRTSLIFDGGAAAVGVFCLWGAFAGHRLSTTSQVVLVVMGVVLVLPLANLGRRWVGGRAAEPLYYRFGSGWIARGWGSPGGRERVVRTDRLKAVGVTANIFARYSVDLTDEDGRRVRLSADDLGRPEYWRAVVDGVEASVAAGTLAVTGPRMARRTRWLQAKAAGATMPGDYRRPGG